MDKAENWFGQSWNIEKILLLGSMFIKGVSMRAQYFKAQ